jgi:subtilisin
VNDSTELVSITLLVLLVTVVAHAALEPGLTRTDTGSAGIDDGGELVHSAPSPRSSVDRASGRTDGLQRLTHDSLGVPSVTISPSRPDRPRERAATLGSPLLASACVPSGVCPEPGTRTSVGVQPRPRDRTPYGIETVYGNPNLTRTTGGEGVDVAVLDTGVATEHPDLRRRVDRCRDYTVDPIRYDSCDDDNGHGTHVAGTVLADGGPNGTGIYGVAPDADLFAFKVCTADRRCSSIDLRAAIRDAADAGAEIVVLSLGGQRTQHVQSAVQYAHEEGVLVIAAAGNGGPDLDTMSYPAADELVVGVGALERGRADVPIEPGNYRVPDFSSRGRDGRSFERDDGYMEVSAPGVGVLSTWPGGYTERTGTSAATPHVAGLAARLWPLTSDRDGDGHRHEDVRRVLQRRAPDFDVTEGEYAREGYDPAAGLGLPQIEPPRARITQSPSTPTEGRTVRFSGATSTAPDSTILSYEWDFDGDGTIDARGRTATVVFTTPGRHTVRLRVTDADGASHTTTRTIRVNAGPTAAFSSRPSVPVQGETVAFDASASSDPDGAIVAYEWDFDGDDVPDARGRTAAHAFETFGTHPVTLRVTDEDGALDTTTRSVLINDVPAVSYVGPTEMPAGTPVTLIAAVTDEVGSITVTWEFPDGTSATGTAVTHSFEPGQQVVTVIAEDEYGARTTEEVTLTVRATPTPTIAPIEETTGPPGTDDRTRTATTTGSGPGFGGGAIVSFGVLALLAARRSPVG